MANNLLERYESEAGHTAVAAHVGNATGQARVEAIFKDNGGHLVTRFGCVHFEPVLP